MISPECLRGYACFAGVAEETLREVAMIAETENYSDGVTIFEDGEQANRLYLVDEGHVDIAYRLGDGALKVIDTLVEGELLMWSALVEPHLSTALAVARGEARLIAIDAERLRGLCEADHDLGYVLLEAVTKLLAGRLTNARVRLAAMG